MLTIRESQLRALEAVQRQRLEDDLVAHLRERLPAHYRAVREEGAREVIRSGIERASSYGLETDIGISVFVRLSFVFGDDFDRTHAWASQVLHDSSLSVESIRVARLGEAAYGYLERLAAGRSET